MCSFRKYNKTMGQKGKTHSALKFKGRLKEAQLFNGCHG
uniref:Uncharacterized protein n=1 Tax=Anguilla anguilla TaxID=7936 RepID=A0A0E9T8L9_ANGAN